MREPFVGRATELAELDRQLALAAKGSGRAVLLTGPAGIGKTALIRRCLQSWDQRAVILHASGDPEELTMSGGLLGQLTTPHSRAGADLAALLASGRADALRAGSALLAFLQEQCALARALVVVVDDAQWCDELSLKSLSFAARRLRASVVLCLLAIRADEVLRLPAGITRAVAEYGARLDLGGLDAGEVAAMAELAGAGRLPARAARRLRDHAAGVPLHVRELVHDLPGDVLRTPGLTLPAPRSLEALVLSRLAGCSVDTEQLVVAAAVLGQECTLADAAALAGISDPLPALQEAIEQRLLTEPETVGQRRCAFPHALIRAAIYRDVGVSRRAALHRAAVSLTSGAAALAHRSAGSRGPDQQLAADLVRHAVSERAAGRLADAAEHLFMAARVEERGPGAGSHLLAAVGTLIDLGDAAQARAYAQHVGALPPSAERSLVLGRLAMLCGDYATAEGRIGEAWAILTARPRSLQSREDAAQAACELALMLIGQGRLTDAASWAQRSAEAATTGFSRACPCAVHGGCLAATGETSRAQRLLTAELGRCSDPAGRSLLRAALGAVLLYVDDLAGAAEHLDAATVTDGDAVLPMAHLLESALLRVQVLYRRGDWERAAAEGERLVALVEDLDQGWLLGQAHLAAVYVAAGQGRWDTAAGHLEAAARWQRPGRGTGVLALIDARVAIAVARDDPDAILAAVPYSPGDTDELRRLEPSRMMFVPACAQALARGGRLEQAEHMLRWYEERSSSCGRRSALAAASRARSAIESARQRPDDALRALDASLGYLAGLGMPLEEAMTRHERGRLLRRLGHRRSAAREIGAARALFAQLGARPFIARCDREFSDDAAVWPGAARPPLTPRQLSVARAAASGLSNRAIATELYISIKTVEFHIAQILAKLGLDSRTQIASALTAADVEAGHDRYAADLPA